MRPRHAVVRPTLPLAMICLWLTSLAAAEPPPGKTLDAAALRQLLVKELAAALDGSQRLVPLPRNVSGVVIGPGGEPCFMVPAIQPTDPDSLAKAVAWAAREEPGFRVLWEAHMLGRDGDRSFVIATAPNATVAVIEDGSSRIVSLPQGSHPVQAVRLGKRWVFLTSAGIVMEGEAGVWEGSGAFPASTWTRMLRSGEDGLVVLGMPMQPQSEPALMRGIRSADEWQVDSLALPANDSFRTAVRLADGRWLAIGQRIVELRGERPTRPTEQQLQAAVEAARAGDWPTLEPLLETITAYPSQEPPGHAMGLATLMQGLPDRGLPLRTMSDLLDNTRRQMAGVPAAEGLAPDQAARVTELLAACEAQMRATAAALAEVAPEVFGRSPGAIAAMLRSGMQLYRGRWIRVVEVLRQESVDSAVLHIMIGDSSRGGGTAAAARLESDGSLRIIGELREGVAAGAASTLMATDAGTAYAAIGGRGLARLSAAGTEWLERDRMPAGLMHMVCVDARGRIYLRQHMNAMRSSETIEPPVFWVLDRTVDAVAPEPVVSWPLVGQPAVDADGSVWFLRQPAVAAAGGQVAAGDAAQPGVEIRRISLKSDTIAEPAPGFARSPREQAAAPRLCRLTSPTTLAEYGLTLPPAARSLIAGRETVCIEPQRGRGDDPVFVVGGDDVRLGKNLHALAETAFDAVLQAAPEVLLSGPWCGVMRQESADLPSQILRTKELLWVNAGGRVEVYSRGRPLAVDERLALRNVRMNGPRLVGPLRTADGRPRVLMIASMGDVQQFVWITVAEQGLEIEQGRPAPAWPQSGDTHGATAGLPLVAGDRSAVYVNHRAARVWEILGPQEYRPFADAGAPILAVPGGGGFLAWRSQHYRTGVRICTAAARHDVPALFTRQLDPVAFGPDGRLLCLGPDHLAWLAADPRQGYVVESIRRLPGGFSPTGHVARLGDAEVITAIDRLQRPHVLVVRPTFRR